MALYHYDLEQCMYRSTVTFGMLTDLQPSQRPTLIHSLLFSLRWCARMVSGAIKRLTNSCKHYRNVFSTYQMVDKRLQALQGGPQQRDPRSYYSQHDDTLATKRPGRPWTPGTSE